MQMDKNTEMSLDVKVEDLLKLLWAHKFLFEDKKAKEEIKSEP